MAAVFKFVTILLGLCMLQYLAAQESCKCVNGLNGRDGRDGVVGRDGRDCNITAGGGSHGPRGPIGPPGTNGANGHSGHPGPPGPKGDRGEVGARGDRGATGSSGSGSSVDKSEIEKIVKDLLKSSGGGTGSGTEVGSLKKVTICSAMSSDICGSCKCKDKNYADEFFSRGYYCDCQNKKPERDCKEHRKNGNTHDGVYLINPGETHPFPVYCDMSTERGGWTVFQRRIDDTVDFKRDWFSYKNGFGNLQHEFWLGNENMFLLQLYDDRRGTEMRMDFIDKDGNTFYEKYGVFELGDESTKYKLHVAGYSGNAGNWMNDYNNKKFSTYDNDNDAYGANSALNYGAFWHGYGPSYPYNPNNQYSYIQKYSKSYSQPYIKAFYGKIKGSAKYITNIEMKIRRK